LRDVYYILFRHKWMIAILCLLGIASSTGVFTLWPFPYTSEARLFIRYVSDARTPSDIAGPANVKLPDTRGASIVNSELEILSSRDLAVQVASNLGPRRVLGAAAHSTNIEEAAGFIWAHLTNYVPKDCDVIIMRFTAQDPEVVQPILSGIIAAYKKKYAEIHLGTGASERWLQEQTDESKTQLKDTIDALQREKTNLGITSIDDAKKNEAEFMARTQEANFEAQTELAQVQATIAALRARLFGNSSNTAAANAAAHSNAAPAAPPPDLQAKYQNLMAILSNDRARETELLNHFTTNNLLVQNTQKHRAETEAQIKALEDQNPALVALKTTDNGKPVLSSAQGPDLNVQLQEAFIKEVGLEARIQQLTNLVAQVRAETSKVDEAEDKIMQLKSDQEVADEVHKKLLLASSQARIDNAIGPDRISNIGDVEAPTTPGRDFSKILKASLGVLAFFLAAAFGLPFLIELFLDQSVKRPADIRASIDLPIFISLPGLKRQGKLRVLSPAKNVPLLAANGAPTPGNHAATAALTPTAGNGHVTTWDDRHQLRPFFEAMRDRLMTYFEMINLTHKPKLVAVTSCGEGAGVSTTALGLASSLSETGDGNVLLVSMDTQDGEAHHFYKGKLACGIEEALEKDKRDEALVHNNLYVAKELGVNDALPRVLPKRFSHLVPKMRASDFDYIIFDMPPVSQISITPRLARFMDMVLLVVESEKTNRETATRAATLLAESKTNVGIVLNKSRSYLPRGLQQDL
jgi:Mrp family chromosome partitioning ATPase/uncharacterized protein involved in exopolysaccharide biosynthesis